MNNSADITVSVCMITYNHEHFIAEAIHGVLMQETNFKVELILAEDCSPDNSQKVIQEILDTYKGEVIISYTRHTENKGMMPNFIWALNQCKGKYIALCEGDDYWTDPLKLQKQVDFLEENDDCVICFHELKVLEKNGELVEDYMAKPTYQKIGKNKITIGDLLEYGNCIHTPSVMFRRPRDFKPYLAFSKSLVGDYPLYLFLLSNGGYAVKLNQSMSVYRKDVGVFSALDNLNKDLIQLEMFSLLISCDWINENNSVLLRNRLNEKIKGLKSRVNEREFYLLNNPEYLSKNISLKVLLRTLKDKIFKK
ncbi:glycosyltransferase family 2 protein [Lishizhenia sp.]|uniref:glycosyltransferase family 2 protein n=1 Tax=Lishizhenia sp. TaxID=2497594 RepID=UPI00299D52DE|nr:glycosyltransferase family 2 protein [Lishizhenia sp.]MDX1446043.1 glycosyltransferase family 2 protein [Lishizhenia sp.]